VEEHRCIFRLVQEGVSKASGLAWQERGCRRGTGASKHEQRRAGCILQESAGGAHEQWRAVVHFRTVGVH